MPQNFFSTSRLFSFGRGLVCALGLLLCAGVSDAAATTATDLAGKRFRISGEVRAIDATKGGLALAPQVVTPLGGADAEAFRAAFPDAVTVRARQDWGRPNELIASQLAALAPGESIAFEVQVNREGNVVVQELSGTDEDVARREALAGQLRVLGPGAHLDESLVSATVRVEPAHPAADDANPGSAERPVRTLAAGFRRALAHLERGEPTRLSIAAGVYREDVGVVLFNGLARHTLFVIEGAPGGGTVWSGSDEWPGAEWEEIGEGVFAHAWPHDFGHYTPEWGTPRYIGQRSELMFVDGAPLRQELIEVVDYAKAGNPVEFEPVRQTYTLREVRDPRVALAAGTFGVAERDDSGLWANRIFARPVDAEAFRAGRIEVATRRRLAAFGDKDNLVLRDLVLQHAASIQPPRDPSQPLVFFDRASYQNVLIERCSFLWNAGLGLGIPSDVARARAAHWTLRDSEASYNGLSGISGGVRHTLWERNRTNFNNWRGYLGGQTSWWLGGVKLHNAEDHVVRGHESVGNMAPGFWYDIHCERISLSDTVTVLNTIGLFIELSNGPFVIERALSAGNSGRAFNVSIVADYTLRDSVLQADQGGRRGHKGEPTPVLSTQWYGRSDQHAKQRPLRTGVARHEGNVILGGAAQGSLFSELIPKGLGGDYGGYRYIGENNVYFAPGDAGRALFFHSPENWSRRASSFAAWAAERGEQGARFVDPGFVDPQGLDFRARPDSPLAGEAWRLPLRRIAPETIAAARAHFAWLGYRDEALETLDR